MPAMQRQKDGLIINVASTAMRTKLLTEAANDLELIRNGQPPRMGDDGRTARIAAFPMACPPVILIEPGAAPWAENWIAESFQDTGFLKMAQSCHQKSKRL